MIVCGCIVHCWLNSVSVNSKQPHNLRISY